LPSLWEIAGNFFWDLPAKESFNYQKEIYNIPDKTFKNNLEILVELLEVQKLIDRIYLHKRKYVNLLLTIIKKKKQR